MTGIGGLLAPLLKFEAQHRSVEISSHMAVRLEGTDILDDLDGKLSYLVII